MTYNNMKKAELVNLCKERNLPSNGKVATLIERLETADRKAAEAANAGIGVGANSKKSYAVNAMRPAIVAANEANNRRAITKDDAAEAGVDEERWQEWKKWCADLHEIVSTYVEAKRSRSASSASTEMRQTYRQKIYPAWRTMLKVGEENIFSPKMYLREDDVESLIGFCEDFVGTAMGTEQANATEGKFRKLVETLIGCRIKGCETLPAKDRDLIILYESALRSKEKAEKALNGDGKNIVGIIRELQAAEVQTEKFVTSLRELGLTEERIAEVTAPFYVKVKDLKEAKKRSEKALKKAEETIAAKKNAAQEIYDRIKSR